MVEVYDAYKNLLEMFASNKIYLSFCCTRRLDDRTDEHYFDYMKPYLTHTGQTRIFRPLTEEF